jgi:phospholipid/cholesterol/gamma-HCH transport system substrate-binding protein
MSHKGHRGARRRTQWRATDLQAGLLVSMLIAVGTYLGFTKDLPFVNEPYEVKAVFSSAATQLTANAPVRIAGVNVGKVGDVRQGPGGTALVTLKLQDAARPLRTGTTMKIRPRLLLEGNFFVDVKPGTSDGTELADGATVPLAQTAIAVQSDEVLAALNRPTRGALQTVLKEFSGALDQGGGEAINEGFGFWRGAFANTAVTAKALRGTESRDLSGFIAGQAQVSSALAARDGELADLVTNLARTTSALASRDTQLRATFRAAASTLITARPALADLDGALPAVDRFATSLTPALRAAPGPLDKLIPLVAELRKLSAKQELPALLTPLAPALRDTAALIPKATALLHQVTPVTECVSRKIVPVLNAKLDDGALSSGLPVWRELIGITPGLSGASGNFDANGYAIRYHAGGGENLITTSMPGLGDVVSMSETPIVGARPRYVQGDQPPFRPEAKCADQPLTDLSASAAPATTVQQERVRK